MRCEKFEKGREAMCILRGKRVSAGSPICCVGHQSPLKKGLNFFGVPVGIVCGKAFFEISGGCAVEDDLTDWREGSAKGLREFRRGFASDGIICFFCLTEASVGHDG